LSGFDLTATLRWRRDHYLAVLPLSSPHRVDMDSILKTLTSYQGRYGYGRTKTFSTPRLPACSKAVITSGKG
jgi:hypothetical protein